MKETDNGTVSVLLIGIGGYGTTYLQELTENNDTAVKIAGVCDIMPDINERFPVLEQMQIPVYRTLEAFFEAQRADLAVISSPIHLHYEQVKICLRSGANVLCEKPICTGSGGARELIRLEQESGCFVAVGYQLNYSGEVRQLKEDILAERFGPPVRMKVLHGLCRGSGYYKRNNWAGKITVNGCKVNDSPFNNACAHQFQNMTFLLGKSGDDAMDIKEVSAELYRVNPEVENYDTAAICAVTAQGTPLYYYTSHNLPAKSTGPLCEYEFEKATIYYGKDFGTGPVNKYVAVCEDGTRLIYESPPGSRRLQKLYDAITCIRQGGHPVCTIRCAIPHLETVERLSELPVHPINPQYLEPSEEDGEQYYYIRGGTETLQSCYLNRKMPSEIGADWKK